jgi:hypothetical protein
VNLPAILKASRDEGLITKDEYQLLANAMIRVIDAPPIPPKDTAPNSFSREVMKALRALPPGKALQLETQRESRICQTAAKRRGIKVTTRKMHGLGWVVWRV